MENVTGTKICNKYYELNWKCDNLKYKIEVLLQIYWTIQ